MLLPRPLPYPQGRVSILLVSPLEADHASLRQILDHSAWRLMEAFSCDEANRLLSAHNIPVIICARYLPDGDWKSMLQWVFEGPDPARLIVCSRLADDRLWAEVLNLGCYDLLVTPFVPEEVFRVCFLAWDTWQREREHGIVPRGRLVSAMAG